MSLHESWVPGIVSVQTARPHLHHQENTQRKTLHCSPTGNNIIIQTWADIFVFRMRPVPDQEVITPPPMWPMWAQCPPAGVSPGHRTQWRWWGDSWLHLASDRDNVTTSNVKMTKLTTTSGDNNFNKKILFLFMSVAGVSQQWRRVPVIMLGEHSQHCSTHWAGKWFYVILICCCPQINTPSLYFLS